MTSLLCVTTYRPISLLCILSKVLERIVYNNMIDYIRALSTKHQFGFFPGMSVLQQLLIFTENLLGSKCEVNVVYMQLLTPHLTITCSINSRKFELLGNLESGLKHIYQIDVNVSELVNHYIIYAMYFLEYLREVFWVAYCLLYLLMIYLAT